MQRKWGTSFSVCKDMGSLSAEGRDCVSAALGLALETSRLVDVCFPGAMLGVEDTKMNRLWIELRPKKDRLRA